MIEPAECSLKAENYAIAARLAESNDERLALMRLAALWRANSLKARAARSALHVLDSDLDDWRD